MLKPSASALALAALVGCGQTVANLGASPGVVAAVNTAEDIACLYDEIDSPTGPTVGLEHKEAWRVVLERACRVKRAARANSFISDVPSVEEVMSCVYASGDVLAVDTALALDWEIACNG